MDTLNELESKWNTFSTPLQYCLYHKISKSYEKPPEVLTEEMLIQIFELKKLSWVNSTDLSGISGLTNLVELELHCPFSHDYEPLRKVKSLKKFQLDFAKGDLGFISSFEFLTHLGVSYSDSKDLDFVKPLTLLKSLETDIQPLDLSPLKDKIGLQTLRIDLSNTSSIEALAQLTRLTTLTLTNAKKVKNFYALKDLTQLKKLSLSYDFGQLTSLQVLSKMNKLTYLSIYGGGFSDITPLSNLKSLTELEIKGIYLHPPQDWSALIAPSHLKKLSLRGTKIKDLSTFPSNLLLTHLNLDQTYIQDITGIEQLIYLTDLSLEYCALKDITPLEKLTGLQKLNLKGVTISDFSPIYSLKNLKVLKLNKHEYPKSVLAELKKHIPNCKING